MPTLLLLAGCTGDKQQSATEDPATERKLPWQGVNLRLIVAEDRQMAEAINGLRGEWQGATGAQLEVEEISETELLGDDPPQADALIFPAYDLGVLAERDRLQPPAEKELSGTELAWADVFEAVKTHDASWASIVYAFPLGSPTMVCAYRKDLLETLNLTPPKTWEEYGKVAAALANRDKLGDKAPAVGTPWSGVMEPLAEGWAGLTLLARAAAYAKHRNHYSTLFDMESMDPLISGPGFVRALDELIAAKANMADEALQASPKIAHEALLNGHCGMALTWTSPAWNGIHSVSSADEEAETKQRNEFRSTNEELDIGFVELPGSPQAFNPKTQRWDSRREEESRHVPLVGISGRLGAVTSQSEHADAAFHLLAWLSGPQWSKRVSTASAATTLFRRAQVETSPEWVDHRLSAAAALEYGEAVEKSLSSGDVFGAPRIAGRSRYLAAIDAAVREAFNGKASSEAALESAANEWRQITAELGLEAQRTAYRRSLGLR